MTRPRVLLADDHRLLREAFARLLEADCEVAGVAADGREAVELARRLRPDVVVLDVAMPVLNGLDAARQLRDAAPGTKVVFLTVSEDPDVAAEAFRAGASGFLLKNSAATELVQAIFEVYRGRTYITPAAAGSVVGALAHTPPPAAHPVVLSARQWEVLRLVAGGRTMKEIARQLAITPRTVAFHKYSMMEVLGLRTSAELIQYALKHPDGQGG